MELETLTIKKIREGILNKEFSALDVTSSYLENIYKKNKEINAYLEIFDDAIDNAKEIDKKIEKKEEVGLLAGVPIALKDNILIKGKIASAGSKILENYRAPYNASVTQKLKNAGAIFLGRTNMDEFAMGSSNENSAYGVVKNPHDLNRVPGGSSGGSAASVSMNGAICALGSDTGGSVRQPASLCGVVGLKPTYGSVSRNGLIAMGSSLDVIGPIAKTVQDCEEIYEVIKGKDKMDSTSVEESDYIKGELKNEKDKIKIGIPNYIKEFEMDEKVRKNFYENIDKLKSKGFEIKEIDLTSLDYALAVYYIIMPAEVSSNLSRFDGIKYGSFSEGGDLLEDYLKTRQEKFGEEARRRIMLGTYVLSAGYYDAYYRKARRVREFTKKDYKRVFDEVDVIATPTTPETAFKFGEKKDPISIYLSDIFTVSANLAGVPAISVPSGFVEEEGSKLPLGIQFKSSYMREDVLFKIGKEIEK